MPMLRAILSLDVLFALLVGVCGGMFIGAMPGLNATMGVTLLIPLTFGMNPVAALIMLTSVYTSAIYGGSITAILIHTPGTPSSAATADDGFALVRQGLGTQAVGMSTVCSMIGGAFSGIALLTLSPLLAQFALKCSALEYFLMGIFGIIIMGNLSQGSRLKGILSGVIGLFIGVIGLDPVYGVQRYTMGSIYMEGGIPLAPALIGVYAISQVLISVEEIAFGKTVIFDDPRKILDGSLVPKWSEFKKMTGVIVKSSIIGIIIGIVPAAGGDVGSWMAYQSAKNSSKHPELFGKGSMEAIAASESANNAVTGGALIPLLTLGIPGSGVAAILLGGLMIHGLQPGAELFTKFAHITYPVIWGFILANILMGVIGLCIAKQIAKVCIVPMAILCPVIIALATIGAYATNSSFFDVIVMAVCGALGFIMRKTGFPVAPLSLGLCISSMIEANWQRVLVLSRGDVLRYFLRRPISIGLALLVIFTLVSPLIAKRFKTEKEMV